MFSNLRRTVKFFSSYVYNAANRLQMVLAHTVDGCIIAAKTVIPIIAFDYLLGENKVLGGALLVTSIVAPRLLTRLKQIIIVPVAANVQRQLTQDLHEQTFLQPYNQHVNTASGEFAQAIATNYSSLGTFVQQFYGNVIPFLVESSTTCLYMVFKYQWPALIMPASLGILAVSITTLEYRFTQVRNKSLQTVGENYGAILASIGRHKMAKQFNRLELEKEMIKPLLTEFEKSRAKEEYYRGGANLIGTFLSNAELVFTAMYTTFLYNQGRLGLYDIALLNYFAFNQSILIDTIPNDLMDISSGVINAQPLINFKTRASEIADKKDATPLVLNSAPSIAFRNVFFSYQPQQGGGQIKEVLNEINLNIRAKETVAFVGKTGVGKSTIVQLLQRFYLPVSGNILINGQNIMDITAKSLYHCLSVVEQNTTFTRASWFDNIKYAREDSTAEQVVEAARLAGLLEPEEADNELYIRSAGIEGHALSGGQKQRIAIARAILKGGLILVLDEATSALDPITEQQVQETLNRLSIGITTVIITHKLYLLSKVDRVYYLDDKKIVEEGTCAELIANKGFFYNQLQSQLHDQHQNMTPEQWVQNIEDSAEVGSSSSASASENVLLLKNWRPYQPRYFQNAAVVQVAPAAANETTVLMNAQY